jgi:hypothetical protein
MKVKVIFLLGLLVAFVCIPELHSNDVGKVIFCTSIDEKLNPVDIKSDFDTNQISVMFSAPSDKKFGVLELILSIYKEIDNGKEVLVHREKKEINPKWNVLILKDLPLPEVGTYIFSLTSTEGKEVSSGLVNIKNKNIDKDIPENNEIQGVSLEYLFDKYQKKADISE